MDNLLFCEKSTPQVTETPVRLQSSAHLLPVAVMREYFMMRDGAATSPRKDENMKKDWTPKRKPVPSPAKVQVVCLDDIERWAACSVKAGSDESSSTCLGECTPVLLSSPDASSKASSEDSDGSDKSSDTEDPPGSPPVASVEPPSPGLSPVSRLGWSPRVELPPTGFLRLASASTDTDSTCTDNEEPRCFGRVQARTFPVKKKMVGWTPRLVMPLGGLDQQSDSGEEAEDEELPAVGDSQVAADGTPTTATSGWWPMFAVPLSGLRETDDATQDCDVPTSPQEEPPGGLRREWSLSGWSPRMTIPLSEPEVPKDWNNSSWLPAPSPKLPAMTPSLSSSLSVGFLR